MKTSPRKENIVWKSKFWIKNESDLQVEQYIKNFKETINEGLKASRDLELF